MLKQLYRKNPFHSSLPAAFGRLCVETIANRRYSFRRHPAAFGRLCVETDVLSDEVEVWPQPPSGGCVLKPEDAVVGVSQGWPAAFGRLCVETTARRNKQTGRLCQPPSGGCVLKHGRISPPCFESGQPPSGGCVLKLTHYRQSLAFHYQPPSGGW